MIDVGKSASVVGVFWLAGAVALAVFSRETLAFYAFMFALIGFCLGWAFWGIKAGDGE